MKHYVKIRALNGANPDFDTDIHVRTDMVTAVHLATLQQKNQREEINSLIFVSDGGAFATKEFPETILEQIREAESDIPRAN